MANQRKADVNPKGWLEIIDEESELLEYLEVDDFSQGNQKGFVVDKSRANQRKAVVKPQGSNDEKSWLEIVDKESELQEYLDVDYLSQRNQEGLLVDKSSGVSETTDQVLDISGNVNKKDGLSEEYLEVDNLSQGKQKGSLADKFNGVSETTDQVLDILGNINGKDELSEDYLDVDNLSRGNQKAFLTL